MVVDITQNAHSPFAQPAQAMRTSRQVGEGLKNSFG